jgi:hypothetical protein
MVSGETFQDRTKGKDVRTSNIVAAKVRLTSVVLKKSETIFTFCRWRIAPPIYLNKSYSFDSLGHCKCCKNFSRTSWNGQASSA